MKKKLHEIVTEHIAKLIIAGVLSFLGLLVWQATVIVPELQANDHDQDTKIDKLITVNCRMAVLSYKDDSIILEACNK